MATAAQDTDFLTVNPSAGGDSNPLDAVFNLDLPADDAAASEGATAEEATLEDEGAQGADEELDENGEPVAEAPKPKKTKQPDSADMVSVKLRGQEIQIPKSLAPAFEALQADYKAAERKITEQGQALAALGNKAAERPAVDPEKAEVARAKAMDRYDADLWKAIDQGDGKGLTASMLKIIDARHGGRIDEQAETISALRSEIEGLKQSVYQGMGDQLAMANMRKALADDLPKMGHAADAVTAETVKSEFDKLWADGGAGQNAREVYLLALGKVLATPKKPGPKPGKANGAQSESPDAGKPPLDFARPQAPNRVAPSGSGRSNASPISAPTIIGPSFREDLF